MVTIKEELECIKSYIAIQEIRIDNPINLTMHISPLLEEKTIPKLILQPLVENAVFHGIEPKNGQGSITIFVTQSDGMLMIEIDDDGVGISSDKMNTMGTRIEKGHLHGIGITNIRERLELIYSNRAQLNLTSTPGSGTQVIMRLPLLEKQKDDVADD
jgi:two-component system sensor histidine kinase YesM